MQSNSSSSVDWLYIDTPIFIANCMDLDLASKEGGTTVFYHTSVNNDSIP